MDKSIRLFVLTVAMFLVQTNFAQDKRTYRDIAYDYIMQIINYDGQSSWKIVSDKYDKMPNGGYLCTLIISRTTKYYEKELVNNQVQAYGATFNVGVREALVAKEDTQNRRYIVFVDKYGTAHNLVLSRIAPVFHYINGNVWVTNKGRFDDINLDFDCNIACYSYNGDLLWEKDDIAVFAWKNTENNLYLAGSYINNKRSFVGTVNTKTFEYQEKLGSYNVIPISVDLEDEGIKIKQKDENSSVVSSYTIPYAANDRQYQINQVLKKYNLAKTSDQIELGERYLKGDIVDKDVKKAFELFEKAANLNDPRGMYKLGLCYKKGLGVPKDINNALLLFEKSANKGNTDAMEVLSDMYAQGDGINIDISKALQWKELLAFSGNKDAQRYILSNQSVEYQKSSISAEKALSLAKENYSSENYKWAKFCYERAIDLGNTQAMYEYGKWLYEGNGITKDCNKAIDYLNKLGEDNNVEAQKTLMTIYKEDKGVAPDLKKEIYWTTKAANNGDADAQFRLSQAFMDGEGVKKNKKMGLEMSQKAAAQGQQDAIKDMVLRCAIGEGVKKNDYEALEWAKKLDNQGLLQMGRFFSNNTDIKMKDESRSYLAENILKRLAQKDDYEGIIELAKFYMKSHLYSEAEDQIHQMRLHLERKSVKPEDINSECYYLSRLLYEAKGELARAQGMYSQSNKMEAKERYNALFKIFNPDKTDSNKKQQSSRKVGIYFNGRRIN